MYLTIVGHEKLGSTSVIIVYIYVLCGSFSCKPVGHTNVPGDWNGYSVKSWNYRSKQTCSADISSNSRQSSSGFPIHETWTNLPPFWRRNLNTHVIIHPCWDCSYSMLVKGAPGVSWEWWQTLLCLSKEMTLHTMWSSCLHNSASLKQSSKLKTPL